jgi:hypothetical protein
MCELKEAISRLPIPVLWQKLGLSGRVKNNCVLKSPLRNDDRHPSFSIYANGTRFKDHGTGEGGDSFDFYKAVTGLKGKEAYVQFLRVAGL